MRVLAALAVIALAVVGALLHPVGLLVMVLPVRSEGVQAFLTSVKIGIADILGWGLVALLLVMLTLVIVGRTRSRSTSPDALPFAALRSARFVVGIVAYNEADAIAELVRSFKRRPDVIEVLVIDNNSTDGTGDLAVAAGARVVQEAQQGYGYACIRALRESSLIPDADIVVLVEGDGTFVASDLTKFRAYIDQADLVVGTRVVSRLVQDGSQMDYFFTWGNIAVGLLLRLRFWHPQFLGAASLSDVGCTYRVIRKEALDRILPDLVVGGNHFSPHMLLIALYRGLALIEIPVTLRRRIGVSKGAGRSFWAGLGVGLVMIWHIATYTPSRDRSRRPEEHDRSVASIAKS